MDCLLAKDGEGCILKSNAMNLFPTGYKPEVDMTDELGETLASCYMQVIWNPSVLGSGVWTDQHLYQSLSLITVSSKPLDWTSQSGISCILIVEEASRYGMVGIVITQSCQIWTIQYLMVVQTDKSLWTYGIAHEHP